MKDSRAHSRVIITKKGQRFLEGGHVWVYAAEVVRTEGAIENGDVVDVVGEGGKYLGSGFYSEASKIRVRVFSKNANDRFDEAFWRRRVEYAWRYRRTVMRDDVGACRVIFGEADGFPGLTVDRYADLLVTQTLSYGMEKIKPLLFPLIADVLRADGEVIRGIYERNDVAIRALEGLAEGKGWFTLPGERTPEGTVVTITENGILYDVDVENGQKTGFFLDQKYNRAAVARLARGRTVLDCFTHTGSFALNAAAGGAARVTAVDVSPLALETAKENARRNHLDERMDFLCEDVFDLLPALAESHASPYDFIILDPPAFTKSRKTVASAERGYKEINYRAMRLLPRGGYLATCSCSHFMDPSHFEAMLAAAAHDAGVELRRVEVRAQAPDHPVLMNVPETEYLKFYIFQVV